ncbi:MAG TPA: GDSL-type esterase/lipase family protein [Drouetiella sp.]
MKTQALLVILSSLLCLSSPSLGKESHPDDRFEQDVQAYEAKDKENPPPPGKTLFIGSSTFARWASLEKDLSDLNPLNRGFGGSTIPEIIHYEKRLVAQYKPSRIVFYAGTNDLAEGHSSQEVCDDFFKFVAETHKDLPDAEVYFISISVAPSRLELEKEFDAANDCIVTRIKDDKHLHFIDMRPIMRDDKGQLKAEFFGPDNLHMTPAGYAAWSTVLEQSLK